MIQRYFLKEVHMALSGKQKRGLRAAGTYLKPEVWIGKEGITDGTIQTIENSFNTKELVKIKLLESFSLGKEEAAEIIREQTNSEVVQIIGHTILIYRPFPKEHE
jgi:RNA-binding protein